MGAYLGQSVYNDSQVTEEKVEELIEENGKGVFFAKYNETTYNDVATAYDEGKIVIAVYRQSSAAGSSYDYFTLVNYNQAMGHSEFVFVEVRTEKLLKKFNLTNDNGWGPLTTVTIGLPTSTAADAEKVLTVDSNGNANYDYLPIGKFGVETPLDFKKDSIQETVIGFNSTSSDYLKKLVVGVNGSINYEMDEFFKFGVESPLKFNETNSTVEIVFDTTQSIGMFLFARPISDGGGVVWKYSIEEILIEYNNGNWEIQDNKTWSDIISAINYNRTVKIKMVANTNDFYYFDLARLYDTGTKWEAWFQKFTMLTDSNNNNYFRLQRVVIDDSNNVTYNEYKPAYEP